MNGINKIVMTIYGLGAYYSSRDPADVSNLFISQGVACVGWDYLDAPPLHEIMHNMKIGDMLYIKSYPRNMGLIIKAVGFVIDNNVVQIEGLGNACIKVKWIWSGIKEVGMLEDKYIRTGTLYEEYNPEVQKIIINLIT